MGLERPLQQGFDSRHRHPRGLHGGEVREALIERLAADGEAVGDGLLPEGRVDDQAHLAVLEPVHDVGTADRKSTRLNSSHVKISYAVFCLKKKKNKRN